MCCMCRGRQTVSRPSLRSAVQSKLWSHAWRLLWTFQVRRGMMPPQEEQPPCHSETWSTRRAPPLADRDGNGGSPFGTATVPAKAASLSGWCPLCGTVGSHLGGLEDLLRWSRWWGCISLCNLGRAASRHGWMSLRTVKGACAKSAVKLKPHETDFSFFLSWLCSRVKIVTWRFEEEQTGDESNKWS